MSKLMFAVFLVCAALRFTLGNCNSGDELQVSVDVYYSAPGGFFLKSPYYRAASSLTLTCKVEGLQGALTYNWTSDCTGGCFTQGRTTQSVEKLALQSTDSGFHTCTVTDPGGCTGNATIEVKVVGIGVYLLSGHKVLPENAVILATSSQQIPDITCLSGSTTDSVGQLIGVQGQDVTHRHGDPFSVVLGSGMVRMQHSRSYFTDEGIYSCRLTDETGNNVDVNFGLYLEQFNVSPTVTSLDFNGTASPYTFTCVSTGSPPTVVEWMKNNNNITIDGTVYKLTHILINRRAATFMNVLTVDAEYANMIGNYSCRVVNVFGVSERKTTDLKALDIRGNGHPLIIGLNPVITCSTHLTVTGMEWLLLGFADIALGVSSTQMVSLAPTLTSDGLNGAMLKCRATTPAHGVYEETITLAVKELENLVNINAPQMPLMAGQSHTLDCVVYSDISPQVKWMGPDGSVLAEGDGITIGDPVMLVNGTVTVGLRFTNLRTSQAGQYTCQSVVQNPSSVVTESQIVSVQVPSPRVSIRRSPNSGTLYTTDKLDFICTVKLTGRAAVDTGISVSTTWHGPSGVLSSGSGITVSSPVLEDGSYLSSASGSGITDSNSELEDSNSWSSASGSGITVLEDGKYKSLARITSLQSSDNGTYTCTAIVSPDPPSTYVIASASSSDQSSIDVDLNVTITIQYSPPSGVTLRPPNYRPATSVSLRCDAAGTTGYVRYRWSSTCGSGCFVSGSSQTVSRSYLFSHDAGYHTCVVTDGNGNTGSATTEMNIIGGGIYARSSYYSNSIAMANNSALVWKYSTYSYYEMDIYCMSNSTSSSTGSVIRTPYSNPLSTTSCGVGCYRMYSGSSSLSSSYQGIYTCRIADSNGVYLDINFGIYPYNSRYSSAPAVISLKRTPSSIQFTLTCISTTSPPTNVVWTKDGTSLKMDGAPYQHSQVMTNRYSSTYSNILTSTEDPDIAVGNYKCTVSNRFGSSSKSAVIIDLNVAITIQYNPPSGVTLRPPNYRPATSVSLRCDATGTTGSVTYQWSSTCGSGCFISGSSQTVSRSYLFSYDAGNHTCVVTDGAGNIGTATTEMNIIGAGMYASSSQYSNSVPLSNNSAIVWTSYYSTTHYNLYCMSNASSTSAYVVYPRSSSYSSTTTCGTGCYRLYYNDYRASLSSSYQGIYTCRIQDSRGIYLDVSTGIYPNGFNSAPVTTSLQQTVSTSHFTLTCTSTTSPATTVVWTKDGTTLTVDGAPYQHSQVVTDRRSSTYQNILTSSGNPDSVVGNYNCAVSNRFGSSSMNVAIQGLSISGTHQFTVGDSATFTCTNDVDVARSTMQWIWYHRGNTTTLVTTVGRTTAVLELNPVTVEMHGTQLTCKVTSTYGVQEKSITVAVEVPHTWSTVEVEESPKTPPTEGYDYTLLFTATLNVDLDLEATPTIVWLGPGGSPVSNGSDITVNMVTMGNETRLSLNFLPLNSTHGGEYSCNVSVNVPYLNVKLSKVVVKSLVVTSQAQFQLKIGPVQHCIYWSKAAAIDTNLAIRAALTDAINDRCNCGFQIEHVFEGFFSCQTMKENAIYKSKINGTSDKHHATELLAFIQDWVMTEGTFTVDLLQLRVSKTCSPLHLQSLHQPECSDDSTKPARGGTTTGSYIGGCFDKCLESECSSLSPA